MIKRILLAGILGCLGILLIGCGGGGGAQPSRGVAHVTLTINVPSTSVSRLIPSNVSSLSIAYTAISGGALTPGVQTVTSVTGGQTYNVTLANFAAGVQNTITVLALDTNGATVASGSTTVDVAPDSSGTPLSNIDVTLQSTVTGAIFAIDGNPIANPNPTTTLNDSNTHALSVSFTNGTTTLAPPILGPNVSIAWTTTASSIKLIDNGNGTASVQRLAANAAGATVTVTYIEYSQIIGAFTLKVITN